MKTITNLIGTANPIVLPVGKTAPAAPRWKEFRKVAWFKDKIVFASTSGGRVEIPFSELWKMAEANDPNLIPPKIKTP